MAITITVEDLADACRVDKAQPTELDQIERLRSFATQALLEAAPDAPDVIHNEAAVRLVGYLYDQPFATPSISYANALRNSGAASMIQNYRSIGVGLATETGELTPGQTPAGTAGLPVIPLEGSFALEAMNGRLIWTAYGRLLGGELYAIFAGGSLPQAGDVLAIDVVDALNRQIVIRSRSDLIDAAKLATALGDYRTLAQIEMILLDYVLKTELATTLEDYVSDDQIAAYPTRVEVEEIVEALGGTSTPTSTDIPDTNLPSNNRDVTVATDITIPAGTTFVQWTGSATRRNQLTISLVRKSDGVTIANFGRNADTQNYSVTRFVELASETEARIRYVGAGSQVIAITSASVSVVSVTASTVVDQTARDEAQAAQAEADHNSDEITALQNVTNDLHAVTNPLTWQKVTDAQGGIAVIDNVPTLENARNATGFKAEWTDFTGITTKYFIYRIPAAASASSYREHDVGEASFANVGLNQMNRLGTSSDGSWQFYADGNLPIGVGSVSNTLQISSHATGDTRFDGVLGNGIVSLGSLADAVKDLLLPNDAGDDQFAQYNGTDWVAVNAPSGGPEITEIWSGTITTDSNGDKTNTLTDAAKITSIANYFKRSTKRDIRLNLRMTFGEINVNVGKSWYIDYAQAQSRIEFIGLLLNTTGADPARAGSCLFQASSGVVNLQLLNMRPSTTYAFDLVGFDYG
ncbi:MAG: hypothetical protein OXG25_02395 [Gammaproteobacteria bacterium]|nr:hypothetical protein [Gammaproteobacteria bacterium]